MTGAFVLVLGVAAFFGIITLLDWLGQRKERDARNRAS